MLRATRDGDRGIAHSSADGHGDDWVEAQSFVADRVEGGQCFDLRGCGRFCGGERREAGSYFGSETGLPFLVCG